LLSCCTSQLQPVAIHKLCAAVLRPDTPVVASILSGPLPVLAWSLAAVSSCTATLQTGQYMDAVCVTVRVLGCCQLTMLINVLGAREGHVQRAHWTCCGSAGTSLCICTKGWQEAFLRGRGCCLPLPGKERMVQLTVKLPLQEKIKSRTIRQHSTYIGAQGKPNSRHVWF
jgi:hypothetical protein